jgi:hypothetical protein
MSKPDYSYTLKNGYADLWDISIIDLVPGDRKDGNVFTFKEGLVQEYLFVYLTSLCTFATIFFCFKTYFEKI